MENEEIKVVFCEPGKKAVVKNIELSLESLQKAVDGCIEPFYPFEEEVCIVCNDEGKYNGMVPNRAIYADGEMVDIVFGPFFICDCSGEDFGSLTDEQIERYQKLFCLPETFFHMGGSLRAVPYEPEEDEEGE